MLLTLSASVSLYMFPCSREQFSRNIYTIWTSYTCTEAPHSGDFSWMMNLNRFVKNRDTRTGQTDLTMIWHCFSKQLSRSYLVHNFTSLTWQKYVPVPWILVISTRLSLRFFSLARLEMFSIHSAWINVYLRSSLFKYCKVTSTNARY